MTPEERYDRMERVLGLCITMGRKAREEWRQQSREQNQKINILIQAQMETSEQIDKRSARTDERIEKLSVRTDERIEKLSARTDERINKLTATHAKEMAELRKLQVLTHQELRAFIRTVRKRQNGKT